MVAWLIGALVGVALGGAIALGMRRRVIGRLDEALQPARVDPPGRTLAARLDTVRHVAEAASAREQAVARTSDQLTAVLEAVPLGLILFQPVRARSGEAGFEVRLANTAGSRFVAARHGDALVERAVREMISGPARPTSRTITTAGPPRHSFELTVHAVGADGHLLATIEDVTARRRLEEVRRDFVANISHELKTPIGAISLLTETLVDEMVDEMADGMADGMADAPRGDDGAASGDGFRALIALAERVHHEANRIGHTIDDLLLLSRIEAADFATRENLAAGDLLEEAVGRVAVAAAERGVTVHLEAGPPGTFVWGDRRQLVSACVNLLDNAINYSERGSAVVARARPTDDQTGEPPATLIEVVDSGIGIPARDLDRIFERFYRVDPARSRRTGGTGLGLAIVRHVALNHGGTVSVRSVEGEGSTFTLTIPHPVEELDRP